MFCLLDSLFFCAFCTLSGDVIILFRQLAFVFLKTSRRIDAGVVDALRDQNHRDESLGLGFEGSWKLAPASPPS